MTPLKTARLELPSGFNFHNAGVDDTLAVLPNQARWLTIEEIKRLRRERPAAFLFPILLELSGPLDSDRLAAVIALLVSKHDALRASFEPSMGSLRQERLNARRRSIISGVITPEMFAQRVAVAATASPVDMRVISVPTDGDAVVQAATADLAARYADDSCTADRMLHATLVTDGHLTHVVALFVNHLVCDAASASLIVGDFVEAYHRGVSEHVLDAQALCYEDVVTRRTASFRQSSYGGALAYWNQTWTDFVACQFAPKDLPLATAVALGIPPPSGPASACECEVGPIETEQLAGYAARHGSDMRALWISACAIAISEISQKSRFPLWTTLPNRDDCQGVVGWFSHRHIIGVELDGSEPHCRLLARVSQALQAAECAEACPIDAVWAERGATLMTGIRIGCDVEDATAPEFDWTAIDESTRARRLHVDRRRYDGHLEVTVTLGRDKTNVAAHYQPQLWMPDRVRALVGRIREIAIRCGDANCSVDDLRNTAHFS